MNTKPSISTHQTYTQALSDLIVLEVEKENIEDEDSPAYKQAEEAVSRNWKALAAIVDAYCAC